MEKQRNNIYRLATRSVLVLFTLLLCSVEGEARLLDRFTKDHPLVVSCDWELPPYEFLDDQGRPAGYTIDLLTTILDKLKVSYQFLLIENPLAADSSQRKRGDLFMVSTHLYADADCYTSSNVAYYYKIKIVSRDDAPAVRAINEISDTKVLVFRLDGRLS